MKILVVDDNAEDRYLLRYNLEHHGCEVIEALDGAEGLHLASARKPDLIVSDALMPVMDGFQFLRAIKRDEALKKIPFVFYSAVYTGIQEVEFAISLGAETFLLKPKDPDTIWEDLKKILETAKQRGEKSFPLDHIADDHDYLQRYSSIVATKLEEKVRELEAASTKIRESEQFINKILETVGEGIVVIGPDYKIISANRAYCFFSWQQGGTVLGKYCHECSHGSDRPCHEAGLDCPVQQTFASGLAASAIHTHPDREGNPSVFEIKSFPMLDASGKVMAAVEVTIDITENFKLEAQLRQAQKMESIGTLAGGIAHDFNNILTAIIGYGQLALLDLSDEDPQRRNIDNMLEGAERAAKLTQDLLLFSRKHVTERKIIDVNDVVRQVEKFLKKVIGDDVICAFILSEYPILVNADSHQLEQVLMNLATNARDAMPKGGAFTVTTEQVLLDAESISANEYGKSGPYALLTVTDTGSGMTQETQQRIFEPFFTTKEIGKGTGLGLAVTYGIISQHEGYIELCSEPGKGTTFRVYLPVFVGETKFEAKAKTAKQVTPAHGTETILLAEDNEQVRELEKQVLTRAGYTVIEAVDGEEAVGKFLANKETIHLLLFDFMMPKMNGYEAYEEIRKMSPALEVIFTSGCSADVVQQGITKVDHCHMVNKPFSSAALLRKVREILDAGRVIGQA